METNTYGLKWRVVDKAGAGDFVHTAEFTSVDWKQVESDAIAIIETWMENSGLFDKDDLEDDQLSIEFIVSRKGSFIQSGSYNYFNHHEEPAI